MEAPTLPNTPATWGPTPFNEGNADGLRMHSARSDSGTLALSQPCDIFGFDEQPDAPAPFLTTAFFFNGATPLGSIFQTVDGDGGARLFAAQVTSPTLPITRVALDP